MNQNNKEILVSISCITYNHAPYIRQCLDGFLMQDTNFEYEILIHDDASTDGTTEIIKEYETKFPQIIKPLYEEENQWLKGRRGSAIFNFPRAKGKYIALCEGDDYWIDPLKLQKQVDILEGNDEYGCVYTAYKTVDVESNPIVFLPSKLHMERSFTGDIFYDLLVANFPQTQTILFRRDLLSCQFNPPYSFDYSLFLSLAIQKPFYYLQEVTSAYRINPVGMVQSGELGKIFDFMAIELYYYVEYLKNKQFRRYKNEDKRIKKLLYTKWCYMWIIIKHYKYFIKILYYNPLCIFHIPLCLLSRMLRRVIHYFC